jgi:acyl-lipid omega-6 desaturase (Delta-12 desaturase)
MSGIGVMAAGAAPAAEAAADEPPVVPREAVRRAMAAFVTPDTRRGLVAVAIDTALYLAALAGVLFIPPIWAKLPFSVYAGLKIANLGTLGHDAVHGNLTRSARLNRLFGFLCFVPGLHNYQIWIYDHHHMHHPYTNGRQKDSWTPFSKAEFDRLSPFRQWRERVYRMPWGLGVTPYYIFERWLRGKFFPNALLPRRFRAASWRHFVYLLVYLAAFLALLAAAPLYSPTSSLTALLLGFVVPFYVWQTLFSFSVYVQHTHVAIPWFDGAVDRKEAVPQENISLQLIFPRFLSTMVHDVYEHAAHHVNPRIPFHRLREAQVRLNEISAANIVTERFSFAWFNDTLRRCKLYDYESNRWLDFDGRPTAPSPVSDSRRAAVARNPGTMFVQQA